MENKKGSGLIGTGLGIASGVLGMIGQRKREERSLRNTKGLMDIQQANQMALNKQGSDLQYEMWKKTNYGAQMDEMKKAGLNPSLMYGMSGGGGTTTGSQSGGGAGSGQAPSPQPMELGSAMQSSMLASQMELMKAQTEKTKAEAEKIGGVDTEEKKTSIDLMLQDVKNKRAQEIGQRIENELNNVESKWKGKGLEQQLDVLKWQSEKLRKEVSILNSEDYVQSETREMRVSQVEMELANSYISYKATEKGIEVSNSQIQKFTQEIANMKQDLENKKQGTMTEAFKAQMVAKYPSIMNVLGSAGDDVLNGIRGLFGNRVSKDVPRAE